jgi:hypothetical protein
VNSDARSSVNRTATTITSAAATLTTTPPECGAAPATARC